MKAYRSLLMGISMLMLMASPALAVDTTKTYSSGILVGIFLAFCALVVVVQLMPTIILLVGFIKGLIKGTDKQASRHGSRG
jgi:prepilin signal peptidase PulO-like enzyme (type II secretory pathway)